MPFPFYYIFSCPSLVIRSSCNLKGARDAPSYPVRKEFCRIRHRLALRNGPLRRRFEEDGDVDGSDLAVFAADFGRTDRSSKFHCEGDFNGDGDFDGSDLAVFAADFGCTDCPVSP